jgi:hypothetical protein
MTATILDSQIEGEWPGTDRSRLHHFIFESFYNEDLLMYCVLPLLKCSCSVKNSLISGTFCR